jgi:DNA-binding NtrC family response regulator
VLFLDEIGDLSPRAQGALLRVLENHAVVPVGDTREIEVDVAVVLATNRDLDQAARDGSLRRDFHDRFRTNALQLVPLRERPWDVPELLEHFRRHHEARMRKRTLGFSQEALRRLVSYGWPGNVREVARSCSLLVAHARAGARLDLALVERCLPDVVGAPANPRATALVWEGASLDEAVTAFKRELLLSRLERHDGDTRSVRDSLGLAKTTFHRQLAELGIELPARRRGAHEPADMQE